MHPSCPLVGVLIKWQEEAKPPCQSSQARVDKVERTGRVKKGGVECLLKRQGGWGQREEWVRFPFSCRGVDIPDWCGRLVGSAVAGTRQGVAWYGYCLISQRMSELEIMSESHESACVFSIITSKQWWKTDSFIAAWRVVNAYLTKLSHIRDSVFKCFPIRDRRLCAHSLYPLNLNVTICSEALITQQLKSFKRLNRSSTTLKT